ncbi:MAG: hypothetical protein HKN60_04970 [Rhizobiales bacterium]|nr:hypothetical protein [Hyphomicrobiales bacterium]
MAVKRSVVIGIGVLVVVAGAAAFVLTSGEKPLVQLIPASSNTIRIEAAGIEYAGWPEIAYVVNDQEIGRMTIDSKIRKMWTIDVPDTVGDISKIELKFTNFQECQNPYFGTCTTRKIIVRGLYLNDEKVENPVASGGKNLAALLQSAEGGITWTIEK